MANIIISVINASSVLADSEVSPAVDALQAQVSNDFAPVWGIDASLTFVPQGGTPAPGSWWLVILDTSDQAGALGYHDLTQEGLPLGKVFAQSDLDAGTSWTVTASHELLEMLGDPDVNLTVFVQPDATGGTLYAYEVCDACEADAYAYKIGDVLVSDFVYPSWFESFRAPNSGPFDHQSAISQPFQLLPGGYIGVFDVSSGTGWHQLTAQGSPLSYASPAAPGEPAGAAPDAADALAEERPPGRRQHGQAGRGKGSDLQVGKPDPVPGTAASTLDTGLP